MYRGRINKDDIEINFINLEKYFSVALFLDVRRVSAEIGKRFYFLFN
jgi:hypothetical protein